MALVRTPAQPIPATKPRPDLFNHYQQYPFDDATLTLLTKMNDFISEQLLMILNRAFAAVKSSSFGGLSPTTPNTTPNHQPLQTSILATILPRITTFAQIILAMPPSQHPIARRSSIIQTLPTTTTIA
jgi:hypothetical protein